MTKKNLTQGLNSLFENPTKNKQTKKLGRPKSNKIINSSVQKGTLPGETRATFIIKETTLDKIKAIAVWDYELVKETINKALEEYINKKKPKPRPLEMRKKEQASAQRLIRIDGHTARLPEF